MHRKSPPNPSEGKTQVATTASETLSRQYPFPKLRLATAYIPPQPYGKQFKPDEALKKGTLWPDLYFPYPPPNPR